MCDIFTVPCNHQQRHLNVLFSRCDAKFWCSDWLDGATFECEFRPFCCLFLAFLMLIIGWPSFPLSIYWAHQTLLRSHIAHGDCTFNKAISIPSKRNKERASIDSWAFGWHFISWMMKMQYACMSTLRITFIFESILNRITCDHWLDKCDGFGRRNSCYINIIHTIICARIFSSFRQNNGSYRIEMCAFRQIKHNENGKEIRSWNRK